jgi:NAD(P)-dependent dehydrogenase (short-subunit alcohol dehydrogenase family)
MEESNPWHAHLTLDLILHVLSRSVFHPFICFLVPLCLRAQLTPYSHPAFIYTTLWACLVSAWWLLAIVNRRVAYGRSREVSFGNNDEDDERVEEVVLITGGCNGLGRLLAEIFGLRGIGVAVLDVREPEGGREKMEEEEGWRWYECDVGKWEDVERVKAEVERDVCICLPVDSLRNNECNTSIHALLSGGKVCVWLIESIQLGKPTILINNAASRIGGLQLCPPDGEALSNSSIEQTLSTNIHAHFNTLRAFLPGLVSSPTGGTIVTISSILAHMTPANLTDYAASKAAVSALHTSLTMELRQQGLTDKVKTILVETGQIDTDLFRGVETPSNFFGPILDTREVAKEIVKLVDNGDGGLVRMPAYARFIDWYMVLPAGLQMVVRWASGIDVALGKAARNNSGSAAPASSATAGVTKS